MRYSHRGTDSLANVGWGARSMPFEGAVYDPETLSLLESVMDRVCSDLSVPTQDAIARKRIALSLIMAANDGERDAERLRMAALAAVQGEIS